MRVGSRSRAGLGRSFARARCCFALPFRVQGNRSLRREPMGRFCMLITSSLEKEFADHDGSVWIPSQGFGALRRLQNPEGMWEKCCNLARAGQSGAEFRNNEVGKDKGGPLGTVGIQRKFEVF